MVLQPFYQGSIWPTTYQSKPSLLIALLSRAWFNTLSAVQTPKPCQSKTPNPVSPNHQTLSVQPYPGQSHPGALFLCALGMLCTSTLPFTKDELVLVKNTSTHPFTKGGLAAGEKHFNSPFYQGWVGCWWTLVLVSIHPFTKGNW